MPRFPMAHLIPSLFQLQCCCGNLAHFVWRHVEKTWTCDAFSFALQRLPVCISFGSQTFAACKENVQTAVLMKTDLAGVLRPNHNIKQTSYPVRTFFFPPHPNLQNFRHPSVGLSSDEIKSPQTLTLVGGCEPKREPHSLLGKGQQPLKLNTK